MEYKNYERLKLHYSQHCVALIMLICLHTTKVWVNNSERYCMAFRNENIYSLSLYRKGLLIILFVLLLATIDFTKSSSLLWSLSDTVPLL